MKSINKKTGKLIKMETTCMVLKLHQGKHIGLMLSDLGNWSRDLK